MNSVVLVEKLKESCLKLFGEKVFNGTVAQGVVPGEEAAAASRASQAVRASLEGVTDLPAWGKQSARVRQLAPLRARAASFN